ncbi:MAG: FAD-dependent oxidoreductase [Desulfitobacterium sp.]
MKVVIIGGVAAGPKVAARLRRLSIEAEITIIEKGKLISYGSCGLPFYVGNSVPEIDDLLKTTAGLIRDSQFFKDQKGVNILTETEALAIDRLHKNVKLRDLTTGEERELDYDYLVLATGATEVVPPLPGVQAKNVYTLHHPDAAVQIRSLIREKKIKHATVIGAGLIGIETADAILSRQTKVALCESQSSVLPKLLDPNMAILLESRMRTRGIDLHLGSPVKALEKDDDNNVNRVVLENGEVETELVVIAVGVRPEVSLARQAGLAIGVTGAIQVNQHLQTDDPFIFAGGDCAEQIQHVTGGKTYVPLASTANKQGRVIADNIAGRKTEFPAICGTSVLQAFDLNIGRTGLGEYEARQLGYDVMTSLSTGLDATHYYPVHDSVTIKLIAEESTGRLLGAQVCGQGESIKRLDVLATILHFNGTVSDISNLDLGYAPPFATAIDVLIHAANTFENKQLGLVKTITPLELLERVKLGEQFHLVDVREDEEVMATPFTGSNLREIPLGELRSRYQEIPKEGDVISVCQLGIRSYEAACFLKEKGFKDVSFLEGGMSIWEALRYQLLEYIVQ